MSYDIVGQGERFTPYVEEVPAPQGLGVYPFEYNERVTENFSYSPPPDRASQGGAYGDLRTRPSKVQIAGFFHPYDYVMDTRFQYVSQLNYPVGAWLPTGYMQPFEQRVNIDLPNHVAYGSLYQSDTQPYGYG